MRKREKDNAVQSIDILRAYQLLDIVPSMPVELTAVWGGLQVLTPDFLRAWNRGYTL